MFAQNKHLYLIEQVQEMKEDIRSGMSNIELSYNHPCKEIIWAIRPNDNKVFDFVDEHGQNPLTSAILKLNGHERFAERRGEYFNLVQPHAHHTRISSEYRNKCIFIWHETRKAASNGNVKHVQD